MNIEELKREGELLSQELGLERPSHEHTGPAFDVERHALLVSDAVRYLQAHLARLQAGKGERGEIDAVSEVVGAVRLARARGR
jgi:hypothetical protein